MVSAVRRGFVVALCIGLAAACSGQLGTTLPQDRARADLLATEPAFEVTHDGFEAAPIVTTAYRGGGTNNQSTSASREWRARSTADAEASNGLVDGIAEALLASGWLEVEPVGAVRTFERSISGGATGSFVAQALLSSGGSSVILSFTAPGYSGG